MREMGTKTTRTFDYCCRFLMSTLTLTGRGRSFRTSASIFIIIADGGCYCFSKSPASVGRKQAEKYGIFDESLECVFIVVFKSEEQMEDVSARNSESRDMLASFKKAESLPIRSVCLIKPESPLRITLTLCLFEWWTTFTYFIAQEDMEHNRVERENIWKSSHNLWVLFCQCHIIQASFGALMYLVPWGTLRKDDCERCEDIVASSQGCSCVISLDLWIMQLIFKK